MQQTQAAVITAFGEPTEVMDVPLPPMKTGSTLLRVDAATLCGTDIGRWKGALREGGKDQAFLKPLHLPFVPGHEICGTVEEAAGPVRDILGAEVRPGDRVISSYGHCGECYYCRVTRQTSFCAGVISYGHWQPEQLRGGCARHQIVPPSASLIRVPDGISPAVAASGSCALRTVMHAMEQLGAIESHETVLVLGAGPLGLYALAVAADRGAGRKLMIGAPERRLDVARGWGADRLLNLDEEPDAGRRVDWVLAQTGGRGADIVINCASGAAIVEALRMCRPGGRLSQIASSSGAEIGMPGALLFKGVRMSFPVMAEARHFYQAMVFLDLRRNDFPFDTMISSSFSLEETGAALAGMAELREMKPVIFPNAMPGDSVREYGRQTDGDIRPVRR
ncbi:alcohol dehydrogenase catalytic domain-containing protein [Fertoebacter nigrum]|uniref:Alcohol dehydrogenase catalytic domain-containing protein n=1 Tax=Fertoeibacter niger TaxID=2656921 RepID=A0A8X8H4U0_9RHOB|nr:zinc-binding dehydrogenase [Fertoeibacter niger]NUB45638.1 alcohol dehydrogenase catalytic domain-containing protein [Fertoeibacter niger]